MAQLKKTKAQLNVLIKIILNQYQEHRLVDKLSHSKAVKKVQEQYKDLRGWLCGFEDG